MDLIFVSSDGRGERGGRGKVTEAFFQRASAWLEHRPGSIFRYGLREYLLNAPRHTSGVLLLIYNELPLEGDMYEIEAAEPVSTHLYILNGTKAARIIRDKGHSNRVFASAGVPVPETYDGHAVGTVFSNSTRGSGRKVWLLHDGEPLPVGRYNVQFIDTSQEFRGARYYVSLRAMCVGGDCYAVYVRARPVSEGDPSVHARNTPRDPDLLAYLNETVAIPRRDRIDEMCRRVGQVLGPGLYAHDILPENTGALYLSEAGFKFDESSLRNRLASIRKRVVHQELFGTETTLALDALSKQYEAWRQLTAPEALPTSIP